MTEGSEARVHLALWPNSQQSNTEHSTDQGRLLFTMKCMKHMKETCCFNHRNTRTQRVILGRGESHEQTGDIVFDLTR
jgi:hypothetical protein